MGHGPNGAGALGGQIRTIRLVSFPDKFRRLGAGRGRLDSRREGRDGLRITLLSVALVETLGVRARRPRLNPSRLTAATACVIVGQ